MPQCSPSLIDMIGIEFTLDHIVYDAVDNKPRIVAVLLPQKYSIVATTSSNYVLDTGFPAMEPTLHLFDNNYFGRRAGL